MNPVALMWETKAAPGRRDELVSWARRHTLAPAPPRRETYATPDGRVLVITWWHAPYDADLPELPEAPGELVVQAARRWRFEQLQGAEAGP
jgi:hypothetical protein